MLWSRSLFQFAVITTHVRTHRHTIVSTHKHIHSKRQVRAFARVIRHETSGSPPMHPFTKSKRTFCIRRLRRANKRGT